jgi:hypothetical protein
MEIKVEVVRENEDGSADAMVHFDAEGLGFLVQEGVLSILTQYIKQCKKEVKTKAKNERKKNAGT